jgi:hypothetical protein
MVVVADAVVLVVVSVCVEFNVDVIRNFVVVVEFALFEILLFHLVLVEINEFILFL